MLTDYTSSSGTSYAASLSVGGNGASTTFSGALSGSGGFAKTGSGTTVLCGTNTYLGGTAISEGGLTLDFSQPGAPATNIINNLADSSPLTLSGGTLAIQGSLSGGTTNSQRFNGLAVNQGSSAIVLISAGTSDSLLLSMGSISRNAGGTLDFTLPGGAQSASNGITTSNSNAYGILGGYATVSETTWATVSGGNILALSPSDYTPGDLGTLGSSSSENVQPSGSQSVLNTAASFNTLNLTGTVGVTMGASGRLTLTGSGLIGNTSGVITGGTLAGSPSGELIVITPQNLTISSVIADNGGSTALTKAGSATLTLTGSNTYSGTSTIGAGTLQIGGGGTLGTGQVNDYAALVFNFSGAPTFANVIGGYGSVTQAGEGIVTLTASNTYTGATTVSAGTLQIGNGGTGALIGSTNDVLDNGSLVFNHADAVAFYPSISGSGNLTQAGTSVLTLQGNNTYTGGTIVSAGTLELDSALPTGGPATVNGTLNLGGFDTNLSALTGSGAVNNDSASGITLTVDSGAFGGTIENTGGGSLALEKSGIGELILSGSNTFTGSTTVDGGTLQIGNGGSGESLASLSISISGGASLVFGQSDSMTYSGDIGGGGSLTLDGPGILILSGSNTYTGGTIVDGGTLEITGSNALPSGTALTVGAGAASLFGSPAVGAPMMPVPEPGALALLAVAVIATAAWGLSRSRADRGRLL